MFGTPTGDIKLLVGDLDKNPYINGINNDFVEVINRYFHSLNKPKVLSTNLEFFNKLWEGKQSQLKTINYSFFQWNKETTYREIIEEIFCQGLIHRLRIKRNELLQTLKNNCKKAKEELKELLDQKVTLKMGEIIYIYERE